ncbi:MAG: carbamoyltransferase HypF [Saprospiraceae bacterium]|jgi:hydrogenase maturation protein HypF|nr:carbamoyltransferase HypF [Saprospiraceae bacterium]
MTWTISIRGQVQGVGFRPFVWRAALERNLTGWVANGLEGVLIKINASEQQALDFQQYILLNAPKTARITTSAIAPDDTESFFDTFSISDSHSEGLPVLHLTPDVGICADCRAEIHDPANRRYRYAFTTCTVCGPRFSILTGLPYDRPFTAMYTFEMCKACKAEYADPANRRYFAQTNSCQDCGIQLRLVAGSPVPAALAAGMSGETVGAPSDRFVIRQLKQPVQQPVQQVIAAWQQGAIVAIKGIGGYLLTCDATQAEAVATLRQRKQRPTKPFAMMYPDLETLTADAEVSQLEAEQLQSPAAPIVLLDVKEFPLSGFNRPGIAPGLHKIGAMLPNAPLFELLLRDFRKPIVATSGNISHAPLIFEDETAQNELSGIADLILTHNRPIVMPQDDSVLAMQPSGQSVILRRARGLAPAFIQAGKQAPDITALALGAEMKSTFALAHLGNINVSQYLGDLADFDTQQRFQLVLGHLLGLFKAQPAIIIGDLHPGYFTTQLGQSLAEKWKVPFVQVQHHKAHFAAVLAENELFESEEPVLGVIWDGTGLGDDKQIWGGEFFIYKGQKADRGAEIFERCGHFGYFPLLLGDKMPREPRLSAFAACYGIAEADEWLQPKFSETEWKLYQKLPATETLKTSSVGRIFDAVASLLGLADKVSYEGEAALLLEDLARGHYKQFGFKQPENELYELIDPEYPTLLGTKKLFRQIISDLNARKEKACIAATFHFSLVKTIGQIARQWDIKKIACSGGVFQNSLLLEMIEQHLTLDYQLFFHRQLSPNDENISFGQWAYATATGSLQSLHSPHSSSLIPDHAFSPLTSHFSLLRRYVFSNSR